ncbi:hypothetical protein [Actinokineospora iranica]|uniref:Uncharacterized protein n=1 Tax=Actinokineospora iranica TaxID=1271860 RepID=A0A1G6Y7C9_9PSEU|nr:hypothetical protein [Actinokineospora iranica]SDD86339.1 hypothetical protein SAMN05216174_12070 [Actinokineospora iranica]
MNEDYQQRAYHALVRAMVQFADPVNCREAHPHDDTVECTRSRAHQEVYRTPHRDENDVEWFSAYCRCAFVIRRDEPCGQCGGSRRLLLDHLPDVEPAVNVLDDRVPDTTTA